MTSGNLKLTDKHRHNRLNNLYLPVTYPQIYVQVAQERGADPLLVLRKAGIKPHVIANPEGRISLQQYSLLVAAVLELTGDHGLGLEVGWRLPPTAHGSLGYALLCCGSLTEAATLIQRFRHLRGRGMEFSFNRQDDWQVIEFNSEAPIPEPLRRVIYDASIASFYRGVEILLADGSKPGELWFDYPEPDYYLKFRERLPVVHYNKPAAQLRIPAALADRPLVMHNPTAFKIAVAQCENEYALLGNEHDKVLARARAEMVLGTSGYPTPDDLAQKLHMSARTLRRRLQSQGVTYKQLLEEARRRDAIMMLEKQELEIQKIALLLGYNDPANFTRAFRHWTGKSPSNYRNS